MVTSVALELAAALVAYFFPKFTMCPLTLMTGPSTCKPMPSQCPAPAQRSLKVLSYLTALLFKTAWNFKGQAASNVKERKRSFNSQQIFITATWRQHGITDWRFWQQRTKSILKFLGGRFSNMKTEPKWKYSGMKRKRKKHKSSFRSEWLWDKRFWDGLLFCPLWTNYHRFLSNLIQPS